MEISEEDDVKKVLTFFMRQVYIRFPKMRMELMA